MTRRSRARITASTLAVGLTMATAASAYDQVYVFGDSLSDVGNLYAATGGASNPPPYFHGRFSDGPVWVEHIAGSSNLTLTPSLLGGTDYAWGGAQVSRDVPIAPGVTIPSLVTQVAQYLATVRQADPQALYTVWGGGNDLFNATPATASAVVANGVANIFKIIDELRAAGAKNILVGGAPDTADTPLIQSKGPDAVRFQRLLIVDWNQRFFSALGKHVGHDPDVNVYRFNPYPLLLNVIKDPTHYGFANYTTPCLTGAAPQFQVCADPAHTLFWDAVHPTSFGHAETAASAAAALQQ